MKKMFLFLIFTLAAFGLVGVIDEVSFQLGITADFGDAEHYHYWSMTRFVVFLMWMVASASLINDVDLSFTSKNQRK